MTPLWTGEVKNVLQTLEKNFTCIDRIFLGKL